MWFNEPDTRRSLRQKKKLNRTLRRTKIARKSESLIVYLNTRSSSTPQFRSNLVGKRNATAKKRRRRKSNKISDSFDGEVSLDSHYLRSLLVILRRSFFSLLPLPFWKCEHTTMTTIHIPINSKVNRDICDAVQVTIQQKENKCIANVFLSSNRIRYNDFAKNKIIEKETDISCAHQNTQTASSHSHYHRVAKLMLRVSGETEITTHECRSLKAKDREQEGKFMLFLRRFQGSQHHVAY